MEKNTGIIVCNESQYFDIPRADTNICGLNISFKDSFQSVNDKKMYKNNPIEIDGYFVCFYEYQRTDVEKYNFRTDQTLIFGDKLIDAFTCRNNNFYIQANILRSISGLIYVNGNLVQKSVKLNDGDLIYFNGIKINYNYGMLEVFGNVPSKLAPVANQKQVLKDYPNYYKSPRIIKNVPIDSVEIKAPPNKDSGKKNKLLKLIVPPLVMGMVTVGARFVIGGGSPFILIMMISTLMTTLMSVYNFFEDKKEMKRKNTIRTQKYHEYLLNKRKELSDERNKQIEAMMFQSPSLLNIERMVLNNSPRIYERDIKDVDFLDITIGYGSEDLSFDIKTNIEEIKMEEDELKEEMESLSDEYNTVDNMPININLRKSHLGLVGRRSYIKEQLVSYIIQLCFLQSYHDLEIIFLTEQKDEEFYGWMKWFNQFKFNQINASTFVCHDNQKEQVLGTLTQALKDRKRIKDEKKEIISIPHYLVIVDNPNLLINHPINEYLLEDEDLGFSLIYTTNLKANLPKNIKTIINIDDDDQVRLLIKDGEYINRVITNNKINNIDCEQLSRTISSIVHNKGITSNVPETVGFLEMFDVETVEKLFVGDRWKTNSPDRTLATPLGFRAENDVVELNLHEKAHGPHGLVAGTTGSGKSEIIQSYILSLAVNFSPEDVGFLLIDFKGGGMAELFDGLPHLLGSITNLDGAASYRALASINSELKRRQQLFNDNGVNNINLYTKKFKRGEASEPLPHLFLISDEFAELKKQQPEFMDELVSTARIGRSLGVHLILATQKPSGVVNDQIWSNSKFKLALKVQDESDSNEILKTKDAARITLPGRAYLQVGNNEIYELFQSAYSGGSYGSKEDEKAYDTRLYKINQLGQGELLNKDLSSSVDSGKSMTELDAVIKEIAGIYDNAGLKQVTKPWLPALENEIINPSMDQIELNQKQELIVNLGLLDIPTRQAQEVYEYNLNTGGNLAIYGASGFGKTTALITFVLELARKNSSEFVHFDLLDFGNSNLLPLKKLNHTRNYINFDSDELFKKWNKKIVDEMSIRKQLFAKTGAMNYEMYNDMHEEKLPAIVIVIDNYEIIKEVEGVDFSPIITKLSRDGNTVGIYIVLTLGNANGIRYNIATNFKTKLSLYQYEKGDYTTILGRINNLLPEVKGRAYINIGTIETFQVYAPFEMENMIDYVESLSSYISQINDLNDGAQPNRIRMLDEILDYNDLIRESDKNKFALGLDVQEVEVDYVDETAPILTILGERRTGKTNVLKLIIGQITNDKVIIIDSEKEELGCYSHMENVDIISDPSEFESYLAALLEEEYEMYQERDDSITPAKYYQSLVSKYIIIDSVKNLVSNATPIDNAVVTLNTLIKFNYKLIVTLEPADLTSYDKLTALVKQNKNNIVLGDPKRQTLVLTTYYKGKSLINYALHNRDNQVVNVQVPYVVDIDN